MRAQAEIRTVDYQEHRAILRIAHLVSRRSDRVTLKLERVSRTVRGN